jgi:hypothetical protein
MNGKGGILARENKDIHAMIDITLDGFGHQDRRSGAGDAAEQRYLAGRNSKAPVEDATVGAGAVCATRRRRRGGGPVATRGHTVGTQRAAAHSSPTHDRSPTKQSMTGSRAPRTRRRVQANGC